MELKKLYHNTHKIGIYGSSFYFSYESLIMIEFRHELYLNADYYKYSRTTSKHINLICGGMEYKILNKTDFLDLEISIMKTEIEVCKMLTSQAETLEEFKRSY